MRYLQLLPLEAFMTFASTAVSIEWNRNSLILKRGASMLLIEAENVNVLRTLKEKT